MLSKVRAKILGLSSYSLSPTSHVYLESSLKAPHSVPASHSAVATCRTLKPQPTTYAYQPHRRHLCVSHLEGRRERERESGREEGKEGGKGERERQGRRLEKKREPGREEGKEGGKGRGGGGGGGGENKEEGRERGMEG